MPATCSHLDTIRVMRVPDHVPGCEDCLVSGGEWHELRMCMCCGHVACCDSSPNQHARAHRDATGHQLVLSAQPGETWTYCFADDTTFELRPVDPKR